MRVLQSLLISPKGLIGRVPLGFLLVVFLGRALLGQDVAQDDFLHQFLPTEVFSIENVGSDILIQADELPVFHAILLEEESLQSGGDSGLGLARFVSASPMELSLNVHTPTDTTYKQIVVSCLRNGRFDHAVEILRQRLLFCPGDADAERDMFRIHEIVQARKDLEKEHSCLKWILLAEQLRNHYKTFEMFDDLLSLSHRIYQKTKSSSQAVRVVEAYKLQHRYADSLAFIRNADPSSRDAKLQIERGWIYHAAGLEVNATRQARYADSLNIESGHDLMRLARLQAVLQLHGMSLRTLKAALKRTPADLLDVVKEEAKRYAEFASFRDSSDFTEVLATMSQLPSHCQSCSKKWIGKPVNDRADVFQVRQSKGIRFGEWDLRL